MSNHTDSTNRDPVTDAPEFHPVGTGVGAATGGAAGAAIGTAVGGPAGGLVGGAIGAFAGGLAGKEAAEYLDPQEDEYWRENYSKRPYVKTGEPYELYRPAYVYGYNTRRRNLDSSFDQVGDDLERGWESFESRAELTWDRAKDAVRDGWNRVEHSFGRMFDDEDEYWRSNYSSRPYVIEGESYETYRPAYSYGYRSRLQRMDDSWDEVEDSLEASWERFKGASRLTWNEAKEAVREGWHRIERRLPGDADGDGR